MAPGDRRVRQGEPTARAGTVLARSRRDPRQPLGPAAPEIGPVAHGWKQVALTQEHAASRFTDGEGVDFEIVEKYVTDDLACVVLIERMKAKVLGSEDTSSSAVRVAVWVTMTLRPEDGEWKVVHRHADPITAPRSAESVIQE